MVHEWVVGIQTYVFFTPDSRSLIISRGGEFSFWDVETFELVRWLERDVALYPGHVAFSPDGNLMALEMAPGVIHLKEVASGRTVAKLEDPHGDRATWQGFMPDGTQLAVVAGYATAIHIWDLRAIRSRLKEMKLDWDWPEFGPTSPQAPESFVRGAINETSGHASHTDGLPWADREGSERTGNHLTIDVVGDGLPNPAPTGEQSEQQAIDRFRAEVETNPDSANACNNLAWLLATAPEALRNADEAVQLAEKAVRLAPENPFCRNTLGVAYYRTGRYCDAIEVLQSNLSAQHDWALAFDLFFLAMSHYQLGDSARARDYYDWAVRWTKIQRNFSAKHVEELNVFRAEVEDLLGLKR
jgi:hypothetical protein